MGFLNKIRNIRNIFNSGAGSIPWNEISRNYTFMEWKGNEVVPGFCVDLGCFSGIMEAYSKCSTLSTIINRNSLSLVNGKWWIVDKKDNDVSTKYKNISQLLKRPNPLQSWSSFILQVDVYRQLFGEVFILANTPVGFSVQEASSLWAINPSYVDIDLSGKMYMQSNQDDIIVDYYINVNGVRTKIEKSNILHIRDTNQNINMSPSDIRGMSRVAGLGNQIRNIIQAEEAVYSLNKDRGAQGILTNKSKDVSGPVQLSDEEKEMLQKAFSEYGLNIDQKKVIITGADMDWKQMSFNVRDLMLFEGMESNIQRISDAFDYPYELLSHSNGVTYANKLEAKRFHYQDNIIPMSKMYAEEFTSFFGLDRASFVIDFGDVECLHKSESEKADTLYKMNQALKIAKEKNAISTAEWRLAINMDEEIYKPDEIEDAIKNQNDGNQDNENTGEEVEER